MNTPFSQHPPRARGHDWLVPLGLWLLLLVLACLRPLGIPDEGRYGEIGRWMVQSGDWLTPRLNGIPFFHKPPYLYWLEAASMTLFGTSIWAVRLVPVLHAGVMLGLLHFMARRIAGPAVATRASWVLGTSLAFLLGGQYVNHDMLVACWISTAIWCFAWALHNGPAQHKGWAWAGYAACGLGILTKGLIGLALPGLVLLLWLIWTRQVRKLLELPWISGLLLFGLVTLPWFYLAERQHPGMLNYMFGTQQFQRFTGAGGATFNNGRPWWFYGVGLLGLVFPWALFALYQAFRRPRAAKGSATAPWHALCVIWVLAIVGFFSIPAAKIIGYVLPAVPAVALLAAWGTGPLVERPRWGRPAFFGVVTLALLLAGAAQVWSIRFTERQYAQDIAPTLACHWHAGDRLFATGYPYDLPFYAGLTAPIVVIEDWAEARRTTGDNWRRELFEGTVFEPASGAVLQGPDDLARAAQQPGQWLATTNDQHPAAEWLVVQQGRAWTLYRSAPKRPETAQQERLPGCHDQSHTQR